MALRDRRLQSSVYQGDEPGRQPGRGVPGRRAGDPAARLPIIADDNASPACRRDPEGNLRLTSRCAALLRIVGLGAGVLAGLFGVGGGFIIVPALVMFSAMGMQRAIGTSLLVITLISASGTASHLLAGKDLSLATAGVFTAGSIAALFAGRRHLERLVRGRSPRWGPVESP
jgi:uncharacterized protein